MKRQSLLFFSFLLIASTLSVGTMVGLTTEDLYGVAYETNQDGTITMNFNGGNNRLNLSSDIKKGVANTLTKAGNGITFTYDKVVASPTNWQVIEPNGYFYNTKAITGLASISIVSDGALTLSYGYHQNSYFGVDITLNNGVVNDFNKSHPSYFEIKNTSDKDIVIKEFSLTYTCKEEPIDPNVNDTIYTADGYQYTRTGGGASLKRYIGQDLEFIKIPSQINGIDVKSIESSCFTALENNNNNPTPSNRRNINNKGSEKLYFIPHTIEEIKNGAFDANNIFTTDNPSLPIGWSDDAIKNSINNLANILFNIKPENLEVDENHIIYRYSTLTYGYDVIGSFNNNETIIIPDEINGIPVTDIHGTGFAYHNNLKTLVLPKHLVTIPDYNVISHCPNLVKIDYSHLGSNVTKLRLDSGTLPSLKEVVYPIGHPIHDEDLKYMKNVEVLSCNSKNIFNIPSNLPLTKIYFDGTEVGYDTNLKTESKPIPTCIANLSKDQIVFRKDATTTHNITTSKDFYALKDGDNVSVNLKIRKVTEAAIFCNVLEDLNGELIRLDKNRFPIEWYVDTEFSLPNAMVYSFSGSKSLVIDDIFKLEPTTSFNNTQYQSVNPLDIIANKANYVLKYVSFQAKINTIKDLNYVLEDMNGQVLDKLPIYVGDAIHNYYKDDLITFKGVVYLYGAKFELLDCESLVTKTNPITKIYDDIKLADKEIQPGEGCYLKGYFSAKNLFVDMHGQTYPAYAEKHYTQLGVIVIKCILSLEKTGTITPFKKIRNPILMEQSDEAKVLPVYRNSNITELLLNTRQLKFSPITIVGIATRSNKSKYEGQAIYNAPLVDPITGLQINVYMNGYLDRYNLFNKGDLVQISGILSEYNNILQISVDSAKVVIK